MWSPFLPIASLTAGLLSGFQHSFNISHGAVTRLNYTELSTFTPYIEFARAAYCNPIKIAPGWKCGAACDALPGFIPTLTGGDGAGTQYFYVGYWPTQSAVVVAHQGTDPHKMLAVLTDLKFKFMSLDPILFPDIPSDIEAHSGFVIEHMKTANWILAEVEQLMDEHSSTNVILVGHSLGGALAELDTLFMTLNLPAGTTIRGVTFGTPRVGNVAWATFFDSQVFNFTRINNKRDPVPVIPGRVHGFGFRHPATEIHIQPDGKAVICPDDGVDPQCSDKLVPDAFEGNKSDHNGPYNGILIGTEECTP
ncbi:Alpha/Beta hydrolase protein [Russula ochroleuca]|uniref:Alpha/Beta hydrolase protein n=1 Tax=Russula ochroleuca TaxID=152965 RepID=A0A9P5JX34_9AGAM|nr:Alpha/Beta hydrolase protein [Russula ochroleuca]